MPVTQTVVARFTDAIGAFGKLDPPVILAVSGGGDSVAMMHLARRVVPAEDLIAVTVDHGLRDGATAEIALVADQARTLGLRHETASWTWGTQGNLQAAARKGRWDCLQAAARKHGATWVWMGHTQDDQIETALMRLARGSGVDGLTGMYPQVGRDGLRIGRPLLGIARADLRDWLQGETIAWAEDPSNDDPRFDRVRTRQMMTHLQALGLTRKRLLQTIDHMQAAHVSLQDAAHRFAEIHVRQDAGDLLLAPDVLMVDRADAPRRVLAAAISWVASRGYRPRFAQLRQAAHEAAQGRTVTLAGVIMSRDTSGWTRLTREAAATATIKLPPSGTASATSATWDRRWYLEGPDHNGLTLRALSEGLQDCPDWRASGLPRLSLLASPSIWRGDTLVAAPLAKFANGWSARIVADFHSTAFAIED